MNPLRIFALRRKAAVLADLASSLDAGLPAEEVLRDAAAAAGRAIPRVRDGFTPALGHVLDLDPVDTACLAAAERAGTLPDGLKERASDADRQARFLTDVVGRLAYPAFLLVAAFTTIVFLRSLGYALGWTPILFGVGGPILFAITAFALTRSARGSVSFMPDRWPWIGSVVRDAGELPYLRAIAALYGSGVRIDEAHDLATRASGIACVRARPAAAGSGPRAGEPLVESLRSTRAVRDETLKILTPAQKSGSLEDALRRAATRRQETLTVATTRLATAVGIVAYLLAAATVISLVFTFYLNALPSFQVRGR